MGRPWHIFTVALPGLAGALLLTLRCLVWAGASAASSVMPATRKREVTGNFISQPPTLIKFGGIIVAERGTGKGKEQRAKSKGQRAKVRLVTPPSLTPL